MSAQKKLLQELRKLDPSALDDRLVALKKELYQLRTSTKLGNASVKIHLFSQLRKEVARILTVKKEGLL